MHRISMHRFKGIVLPILLAAVIWTTPAAGQSTEDIHRMIRQEGLENSQVMDHLQVLTDYFGARLTDRPRWRHRVSGLSTGWRAGDFRMPVRMSGTGAGPAGRTCGFRHIWSRPRMMP